MKTRARFMAVVTVAAMIGALFPLFGASMQSDEETTYTYELSFRWSLNTWYGPDGVSPEQALKGEGPSTGGDNIFDIVTAIYGFDSATQSWRGFFPEGIGIPGANDLETLDQGSVYWFAINAEAGASWTIVTEEASEPGPAATINLMSNYFDPDTVEISVGESVEFVWVTGFHNVVSNVTEEGQSELPEEYPTPGADGELTVTFDEAGTYPFICVVHSSTMTGEIIVS